MWKELNVGEKNKLGIRQELMVGYISFKVG